MKHKNTHTITINGYEWNLTEWSEIYHNLDHDRFALLIDGCIEEVGYLDQCIAVRDAIASLATI